MTGGPGQLYVFGEVLFDHFPTGERILGGAPFNVAWHLHAMGDRPCLVSRVGEDEAGRAVLAAMQSWGMSTVGMQLDPARPTGRVTVNIVNGEPDYEIVPDVAYDFIAADSIPSPAGEGILYHGTLGLRSRVSRQSLSRLLELGRMRIFLDVNLRPPWWQPAEVERWLARASFVKLNRDELRQLGYTDEDHALALTGLQERFELDQVILTLGEAGALVRTADGQLHRVAPAPVPRFVDAVGAGDAFSAVYIHGLLAGWPIAEILAAAGSFASTVIGLRGATTTDLDFYRSLTGARSADCCGGANIPADKGL